MSGKPKLHKQAHLARGINTLGRCADPHYIIWRENVMAARILGCMILLGALVLGGLVSQHFEVFTRGGIDWVTTLVFSVFFLFPAMLCFVKFVGPRAHIEFDPNAKTIDVIQTWFGYEQRRSGFLLADISISGVTRKYSEASQSGVSGIVIVLLFFLGPIGWFLAWLFNGVGSGGVAIKTSALLLFKHREKTKKTPVLRFHSRKDLEITLTELQYELGDRVSLLD